MATARELIMGFPQRVNPEALGDKETVFHFNISGDGGGEFTVDLKNGTATVTEGMVGEAKCVISTSSDTFVGIMEKTQNAMMAFTFGKIKVTNVAELMKFAKPLGFM